MSSAQFIAIFTKLEPCCVQTHRKDNILCRSVPVQVILFVTLRILAGVTLDVSCPCYIDTSTVYAILDETLQLLDEVISKIRFLITQFDCDASSQLFQRLRRSPMKGIISALDFLSVQIENQRTDYIPDPRKYYNRKGFFTIVVQTAVSDDCRLFYFSTKNARNAHYSTALQGTFLH